MLDIIEIMINVQKAVDNIIRPSPLLWLVLEHLHSEHTSYVFNAVCVPLLSNLN